MGAGEKRKLYLPIPEPGLDFAWFCLNLQRKQPKRHFGLSWSTGPLQPCWKTEGLSFLWSSSGVQEQCSWTCPIQSSLLLHLRHKNLPVRLLQACSKHLFSISETKVWKWSLETSPTLPHLWTSGSGTRLCSWVDGAWSAPSLLEHTASTVQTNLKALLPVRLMVLGFSKGKQRSYIPLNTYATVFRKDTCCAFLSAVLACTGSPQTNWWSLLQFVLHYGTSTAAKILQSP